jgi:hypothetical protein
MKHVSPVSVYMPGTVKKIFWSFVMILAYTALSYHLAKVISRYCSHPVVISVSMKQEPQLNFPAVSVCNMNPVRRSAWNALKGQGQSDVPDAPVAVVHKRKKRDIGKEIKLQYAFY